MTRSRAGHRRVAITEAVRFIRAAGATVVDPEALGLAELWTDERAAPVGEDALFRLLYEGLGRETRGLLVRGYLEGATVAALADGPIRGAMSRLGELWQHDARGIFIEHRATDCCIQAVSFLRTLVEPPADGPVALGGAPPGDPYVLPSLLAAIALAEAGLRPVNLGPDTPIASVRLAAGAHRPALVWLSCSTQLAPAVIDEIAALAGDLRADGAHVVAGGRTVAQLAALAHPTRVASMAELAALARTLV